MLTFMGKLSIRTKNTRNTRNTRSTKRTSTARKTPRRTATEIRVHTNRMTNGGMSLDAVAVVVEVVAKTVIGQTRSMHVTSATSVIASESGLTAKELSAQTANGLSVKSRNVIGLSVNAWSARRNVRRSVTGSANGNARRNARRKGRGLNATGVTATDETGTGTGIETGTGTEIVIVIVTVTVAVTGIGKTVADATNAMLNHLHPNPKILPRARNSWRRKPKRSMFHSILLFFLVVGVVCNYLVGINETPNRDD
jgi:hypothetical protein